MMPEDMKTTFWSDFSIADHFGVKGINDTYKRAVDGWKDNIEYFTELVAVLNWKCWAWNEKNDTYMELYRDLYYKAYDIGLKHFKGEELQYFCRELD